VHIVYDEIKNDLPIPLISIIDVTGDEIKKSGMKKVGLLGTIFTMSKGFYKKGLARMGIETILPEMDDMTTVNKIIYEELVKSSRIWIWSSTSIISSLEREASLSGSNRSLSTALI